MASQNASRNLKTRRTHRWEVLWQIILPLVVGVGLAAWGLTALMGGQAGNITRMSQIATIVMLAPLVLVGLVMLALTIVLVYLLGRLMNWIPPQTYRVQRGVQAISSRVIDATDALVTPFIGVQSWLHAANKMLRGKNQ